MTEEFSVAYKTINCPYCGNSMSMKIGSGHGIHRQICYCDPNYRGCGRYYVGVATVRCETKSMKIEGEQD